MQAQSIRLICNELYYIKHFLLGIIPSHHTCSQTYVQFHTVQMTLKIISLIVLYFLVLLFVSLLMVWFGFLRGRRATQSVSPVTHGSQKEF